MNANEAQNGSGALTMGKRQALIAALGMITTGEDNDGNDDSIVSNEQAVEIDLLITAVKADKARFLKWIGVDDVQKILAKDYEKAITQLNAKKVQK